MQPKKRKEHGPRAHMQGFTVEFHCQILNACQGLSKLDPHHWQSVVDGSPLHSEWHLRRLNSF